MAIIRSKIARQLLAEGGAPRKGFKAGSNPFNEFENVGVSDFRMNPAPSYETFPFVPRPLDSSESEDDESNTTTNIFDRTKDFLGRNKSAIGGGALASILGLGPLGILLGGFLGRRRDQGGGIFESAKARDTRIAQQMIEQNRRERLEREMADKLAGQDFARVDTSDSGMYSGGPDASGGQTVSASDFGGDFGQVASGGPAYDFAGGGIASLQPRQGYFLGKLVKKAKNVVKKVVKSDLGKAALTGAAIYGLGGGFGKDGFKFGNIPFIGGMDFSGIPGGGVTAGIVGASLLGGLLTSKEPEQDINALSQRISDQTGIDVSKIRGEVQQAYQNKDTSSLAQKYPFLVNQEYSASFAKGGRTGFAEGTPKDEVIEERGLPTLKTMPEFKGDEVKPADMMMASAVGDESDDIAMQLFGKPVKDLNPSEMQELQDEIDRLMNKFRSQKPREGIMMAGYGYNEAMSDTFDMYNDMKKNGLIPPTMTFDEFLQEVVPEMSMKKDMGRTMAAEGGMMNLGGNEMDLRGGGFVPIGAREKADDVPARLSKNEFVFTADAVRAAGGGSVDRGADLMYKTMKQLENKVV